MSTFLTGLQRNTRYARGQLRGIKHTASAIFTGLGTAQKTFITTTADTVAIIDRLELRPFIKDPGAAGVSTMTLAMNGQSMSFSFYHVDTRQRGNRPIVLRPRGTMWINPSSTLKINTNVPTGATGINGGTADANAPAQFCAFVQYRVMTIAAAISAGYRTGEFWCMTTGTPSGAAREAVLNFDAASVTASRGLEINGFAITGHNPTAATGNPVELLMEFSDATLTTNRKFVKNVFIHPDPDLGGKDIVVNNCVIRGPLGYGLSVTNANGTGGVQTNEVQFTAWGKYYTGSQRTFPGTGIAVGTDTAAIDASDYFWIYSENAAGVDNKLVPATTGADIRFCVDGLACAAAFTAPGVANNNTKLGAWSLRCNGLVQNVMGDIVFGSGENSAALSGASSYVAEDLGLEFKGSDAVNFSFANGVSSANKIMGLVWGRFVGDQYGSYTKHYAEYT